VPPGLVPTLAENPGFSRNEGEIWRERTVCWREMDSNCWYRDTKVHRAREAQVDPDRVLDDHRRKAVPTIGDFSHRASLPAASLPS
jgi:hypothetical protein